MKTTKRFAAIASGLALTAAGFVSPLTAQADVSLSTPGDVIPRAGSDFPYSVSGCAAGDNVYVALATLDDKLVDLAQGVAAADGSATVTLTAADTAGMYNVFAGCGKYDRAKTPIAARESLFIDASAIAFSINGRPLALEEKFDHTAQPLTMSSSGFHAGDKVTLKIYDSEGKLVWSKEAGSADADGVFTGTVQLPADLAVGTYTLQLIDEHLGATAVEWRLGSVAQDKTTISVTNVKPAAAKKPVIGLPKAGV